MAVANIASSRRIGRKSAGLDGAAATLVVCLVSAAIATLVPSLIDDGLVAWDSAASASAAAAAAAATGLEAAALFTGLVLGANAGAHADRLAAQRKRRTAPRGTVSCPQALTSDKLDAGTVSDVLFAGGVRDDLP